MSRPVEVYSDGEGSDYSYTASVRTYDTLDELLTRFTLEFKPEYILKIRNRCAEWQARCAD